MTGAVLPPGADTVVRYEDISVANQQATINIAPSARVGVNVHAQAADRRRGDLLLPAGTRLTPAALAVAATVGAAEVRVTRLARVAVVSTGDELVDQYVGPLAAHAAIRPHVRYNATVVAVGRKDFDKVRTRGREQQPFEIRLASGETIATLAFTEPNGKWDASGIEATATKSGDGYKITGTKMFVLDGNIANLLLAAKFGVPVCPHAGGVGLCEAVQHLSMFDFVAVTGTREGRMIEFVDHLHEHFVVPTDIQGGSYMAPTAPGSGMEMKADSILTYTWTGAHVVA